MMIRNVIQEKRSRKRKVFLRGAFGLLLAVTGICFFSIPGAFAVEEVQFVREISIDLIAPVDVAVASSGDVYVLDQTLARVVVFDAEGKRKMTFGEPGRQLKQFSRPQGIALSSRGDVIVADTGNNRLQVFSFSGDFLYEIGSKGRLPGQYRKISSVTVDPFGYIYVADTANRSISQYTPQGVFLETKAVAYSPDDLAVDAQRNLYVLSRKEGKIVKYAADRRKPKDLTLKNAQVNYLMETAGIAVDSRGDIYLIERKNHSIVKVDQTEQIGFSFGSQGVGKGQFEMASNITAGPKDHLYVADTKNKRVQIFQVTGSDKGILERAVFVPPVLEYDSSLKVGPGTADLAVVAQKGLYALSDDKAVVNFYGEKNLVFGKTESLEQSLNDPQALFVTGDGRMLVTDTGNNRLQFLGADGVFDYRFGKKGESRSEFMAPAGIVADKEGYIYVADSKNNRIQIFNNDGIYLKDFGREADRIYSNRPRPGAFSSPLDLAFNSREELYVLDYDNRRVEVFSREGQFLKEIGGIKDPVKFKDPVDIAVDAEDYLYVADRGDHTVKILNPEGQAVMQFGSAGKGRSYFPSLSAVACAEGKVYVADYLVDDVKVFSFNPVIDKLKEKILLSRVSKPLNMPNATEEIKQAMARKLTLEQTKKELAQKLNIDEEDLNLVLEIDGEEVLESGQLKLTISIPRKLVPEGVELQDKK